MENFQRVKILRVIFIRDVYAMQLQEIQINRADVISFGSRSLNVYCLN